MPSEFNLNNSDTIEQERELIFNVADFLSDYWKIILSSLITLFYTIAGFALAICNTALPHNIKVILLSIWILLAAVFIFIQVRLHKERGLISAYKRRNEEIKNRLELQEGENYTFWSDVFHSISTNLLFGDDARISLYKNQNGIFTMLGRYSLSPQYNKKGRMNYSENEGCISIAWQHGYCFCSDLPDFDSNPEDYYRASEKRFNLKKEIVDKIGMKSRTIYAKAICEQQGKNRTAIVVFESVNEKSFTKENIDEVFNKYEKIICLAIQRFKIYEPNPNFAREEGF